jgi:DNA repair metallo-beta-lactamase
VGKVLDGSDVTLYSLPYSEHSAFSELVDCVSTLALPSTVRIVPTVNCRSAAQCKTLTDLLRGDGELALLQ